MLFVNNAGTTWPKPSEVREAAAAALEANPRQLGDLFEASRETVCRFLGIAERERFLFTSGCTSALSVAIGDLPWSEGDAVLTSSLEHHALVRPIEHLKRRGVEHVAAPYRPGVPIDPDFVDERLGRGDVRLVAVTAASNVTGELLPLAELARCAHDHGALFLVDAAQTVGVVPVDVREIGADILVFAGHKGPLGPQGVGGLWAAPYVTFESPLAVCDLRDRSEGKRCAPMPGYCDVGSVNLAGMAGLAAGLGWLEKNNAVGRARSLASDLVDALLERPFCTVFGAGAERTATVSMRLDGIAPDVAEARFSGEGIVVRGAQHCASMALEAIGALEGTVRVSFGPFNRGRDVERVLAVVDALGSSSS